MALIGALRALGRSRAEAVAPAAAMSLSLLRHMSTANGKLFIGGLAWETDENTLRDAFSSFGEVSEAKIIFDRTTGRSRGFGFVSFSSVDDAQTALAGMDGKSLGGRTIRVDYATERQPGSPRPGGFNRQGGGFRQGGYNQGGGYAQRQGQGGYGGDQGGYGQQRHSQAPQEQEQEESSSTEAPAAPAAAPAPSFAAGGSV